MMHRMSRILVLYASHYGQTRAIAARMTQRLAGAGHAVDLVDLIDGEREAPPGPAGYDGVILGSRIELSRFAPVLAAYVRANRAALAGALTAVFSVSMAAATGEQGLGQDRKGYLATFLGDAGWRPAATAAFAGALPYPAYGWFFRQIMKALSAAAGHPTDTSRNHVLTDDAAVDQLADWFHAQLAAKAAS
jgi:menaquinone-dependent protoporphyrinogen oxidase